MPTFPTPAATAWPGILPRIFGLDVTAIVEHASSRPRHARPRPREIRQTLLAQADAAIRADRAAEQDRDLWALAIATGAVS